MSIDQYLPGFDVTEVQQVQVDALPEAAYAAIRRTDLRDPIIKALFALRELPNRIARKLHGDSPLPTTTSYTVDAVATPEMGWVLLGEEPGVEIVVGAVGRFWRRDYGGRTVAPEMFVHFHEPGYAKIAISLSVLPVGLGGSVLRYEARTATTDDVARAQFRRYWRVIRPGVAIVMRHALARIKAEAEARGPALAGTL